MSSSSKTATALADTPSGSVLDLFSLKGQVALITGGSRGIGASIAIAFAEAGADVVLAQRDTTNTASRDKIRSLGRRCEIIPCDLSKVDSYSTAFDRGAEVFGAVDILLNCGGMLKRQDTVDVGTAEWTEVIDTNLTSLFVMCQAAGRHMIPRGHGKIINVGSLNSFIGGARVASYTASKAAVGGITKALSNEWAKFNINVNAIAPGSIATDMYSLGNTEARKDPTFVKNRLLGTPGNRWGASADFAGPALFLASAASNYVSGETLVVDGGAMGKGPI